MILDRSGFKLAITFSLIYLTIFFVSYPPLKGISQTSYANFTVDSIKTEINTSQTDSLIKKGNSLIENVKLEAKRGKQLAKIAEKESKSMIRVKYISIITIKPGDTLYKSPQFNSPIIVDSDSTYQEVKHKSFWKKLFQRKNK